MLSKLKQRKSEGFTIIEVMIVLAIAGLIMLIVFLAVPALERNAHNTSAKNDVAGLLGAMNEYVNNNNGALPAAQPAGAAGSGTYTIGAAGSATATAKIGYYTADQVKIVAAVPASAPTSGVVIVEAATCNGNAASTKDASGVTASPRSYAAWYILDGGNVQCEAS